MVKICSQLDYMAEISLIEINKWHLLREIITGILFDKCIQLQYNQFIFIKNLVGLSAKNINKGRMGILKWYQSEFLNILTIPRL